MTTPSPSRARLLGAFLLAALAARAQTASPNPDPTAKSDGASAAAAALPADRSASRASSSPARADVYTLNPFEVKSDKDTSYGAVNSNSLTRFSTELFKSPVVADVFTQQFIEDSGFTTLEDLMRAYGNGAGMQYATPSSDSTNGVGNLTRYSSSQFAIRGASASNPRRDGFQYNTISVVRNSLWDVERVDNVHGSQGLLYGAAGGGGVINMISKEAQFDSVKGKVSDRMDQYGSQTVTLDQNYGNSWFAARVNLMKENNQTRFLYVGSRFTGQLASVAVRLPFNTTVKLEAESTRAKILNSSTTSVNMGGTSADPRSGDTLAYLMVTNQLGAINPYTGQPYPAGAIDNGHVNAGDLYSWAGAIDQDSNNNWLGQVIVDTVWTSWLSTEFGAQGSRNQEMRNANSASLISPPVNGGAPVANNTLGDWAVGFNMGSSESDKYLHSVRASALLTNELLDGKVKSQTSIGFDRTYSNDTGGIAWNYYKSDQFGNVAFNPATSSGGGGGRTIGPSVAAANSGVVNWLVGNGPIEYPVAMPGSRTLFFNGQYWTRMVGNPRDPAWITPNNPLGEASLYAASLNHSLTNTNGISGNNAAPYANHQRDQGFYLVNQTRWFDDAFTTMAGARFSDQFVSNPNTTVTINQPYIITRSGNLPSYNLGVDFKIPRVSWLRGYAAYSRSFNVLTNPASSADAVGNLPGVPIGKTFEAGLKFQTDDLRYSGTLSAYSVTTTNDLFSAANFSTIVNPTGISGLRVTAQATPNNFDPLNKRSQGAELILTAQPTRNWRVRFSADVKDGVIHGSKSYKMLYNDQFYTDANGNVTYANGKPFLVPTDAATLTKVGSLSAAIDPTTYGVALTPLTIAMINNPQSPYYAFGQGTTAANQPINGAIGTPVGGSEATVNYLQHALKFFQNANTFAYTGAVGLPLSAMQYNFADPAGLNGNYSPEKDGNRVVGSPVIACNLESQYQFSEGPLKGFGFGGGVTAAWYTAQYYYQVGQQDQYHLFSGPTAPYQTVNGLLTYEHRFRRVVWKSQLNVSNMFNHYVLAINPSNGNGFNVPASVGATYYGFPRNYVWTNTLSF